MKSLLPLLALALLLPFSACEPEEPATDVDIVETDPVVTDPVDDPMMSDGMMADTTGVTAQATLDAAQAAGGLTSLAPDAAVANIDSWISTLEGNPDAAPVVENLRTLRTQLTTTPLDGAAIGQTLSTLGEQTTSVAGGDTALEQLGSALSSAGEMLTNGTM